MRRSRKVWAIERVHLVVGVDHLLRQIEIFVLERLERVVHHAPGDLGHPGQIVERLRPRRRRQLLDVLAVVQRLVADALQL